MRFKIQSLTLAIATVLLGFLVAGVATADYGISGVWYANRGSTVNIPPGQFDGPCPPATGTVIPVVALPVTAGAQQAAPCVRHQKRGIPTFFLPDVAVGLVPQSGVSAQGQVALSIKATPLAVGSSFVVPPSIFVKASSSQIPVPNNAVIQQLDTTFIFKGPVQTRMVSSMALPGGQNAGIVGQTRRMQSNAWNGAGQPGRVASNFSYTATDVVLGVTRRVTYTAGTNAFGGTMGMFLSGNATVYVVADIVTAVPGNEMLVSPIGGGGGATQHPGRGYATTRIRAGNPGPVFLNYNIPTPCTAAIPPTPAGCDLITGISGPVFSLPAATTMNIGFPWTTGHVSVYAKGLAGGFPATTTLTAQGSDTFSGGNIRTIQLVAGGIALRNSPASGLGRSPHLEVVTIVVPEPGSTMAMAGGLALIGGLYGIRRRIF